MDYPILLLVYSLARGKANFPEHFHRHEVDLLQRPDVPDSARIRGNEDVAMRGGFGGMVFRAMEIVNNKFGLKTVYPKTGAV